MLFTLNDSNESKNLFTGRSILNFLNSSLQVTLFNICHYFNDFLVDGKYSVAVYWTFPEDDSYNMMGWK
jgi:type III secretory pathway component EscU